MNPDNIHRKIAITWKYSRWVIAAIVFVAIMSLPYGATTIAAIMAVLIPMIFHENTKYESELVYIAHQLCSVVITMVMCGISVLTAQFLFDYSFAYTAKTLEEVRYIHATLAGISAAGSFITCIPALNDILRDYNMHKGDHH